MGANGRQPRVVRCASVGVFAGSIMEELRRAVFGGTVEVPAKRAPRSAGSQKEATPTSPSCTGALRQSRTHPLPGSRRSGWWSILVPLFRSGNPGRWLPEPDQVSRSPGVPLRRPDDSSGSHYQDSRLCVTLSSPVVPFVVRSGVIAIFDRRVQSAHGSGALVAVARPAGR